MAFVRKTLSNVAIAARQWINSDYCAGDAAHLQDRPDRVDLVRCIPFIILHLGCIGVIWTGWSWTAVALAAGLYFIRMFAITGFYHRYFSHRTFKTNRFFQFVFALIGASAVQRGPLWWASHHRNHHKHSDDEHDVHSPRQKGFWWSHMGWITSPANFATDYDRVKDLAKYRELVYLNQFDTAVPVILAVSLLFLGNWMGEAYPALGVTGWQFVVWGFFISTTCLFHGTCTINSLSHVFGRRRFPTPDDSKNNFLLALITLGEGWHNNHHYYQFSTRQGFKWWEIDITFYMLKMLSWCGIIWNLRGVPENVMKERLQ
ncbi:MAG: acyl-CoA desaturase [Verrucomicrobiae bacterium]|jgi:stearoyl-CoA desaturase (delta-9 desaturase)|nr:acyl-CoA desaturase [Verrucomicrobiae bacterium]